MSKIKRKSQAEERRVKIWDLVEKGYQNRAIAEKTGIPNGTVAHYAAEYRKQKEAKKKLQEGSGVNADLHLCLTCRYRSNQPTVNICDYGWLTQNPRGCEVEECTKYEKGARMKNKYEWCVENE